jgi:hypothetical protein
MAMDTRTWIRSIISVGVSAAASGVVVTVADPSTFNLHGGLAKLGTVCGLLALVHIAMFLQKSPMPDPTQGGAK